MFVGCMTELTCHGLAQVIGGADSSIGRCGPGDALPWLGNVYTPECKAHDIAVRDALRGGASQVEAHVRALPHLPAAVGSYLKTVLG